MSQVGPTAASSGRLLVLEVTASSDSKLLRTVDASSASQIIIALCHEWAESPVEPAHIVRVILTAPDGTYQPWDTYSLSPEHPVVVTRDSNLLIHHPDTLIPCTVVADSFTCLRRSVISSRSPSGKMTQSAAGAEAALFGQMIHDMFQIVLARDSNLRATSLPSGTQAAHALDVETFFEAAEEALFRHYDDLYAAGVSDKDARLVLYQVTNSIMQWYRAFMGAGDSRSASGVCVPGGKHPRNIVVSEVHDIEELIWSPVLGLKGKVDASVHLRVGGVDVGIAVLELKTGKSTGYSAVSHSAQVTLYNMLMSDRKNHFVNHALLTYIPYQEALKAVREEQRDSEAAGQKVELRQTQSVVDEGDKHRCVVSVRGETMGLIMQRNRLASYLRLDAAIEDIPPLLQGREDICAKCFSNDSCLLQHKLLEGGTAESVEHGPGTDLFHQKTTHLTQNHEMYYRFWRNVVAEEEELGGRGAKEIWTLEGVRRQSLGTCVSGLMLKPSQRFLDTSPNGLLTPGQKLEATFVRHPHPESTDQPSALTDSGISEGDYVIVSAEYTVGSNSQYLKRLEATSTWQSALTSGYVGCMSSESISVLVERSLEAWTIHQGLQVKDICWRLDVQEGSSSVSIPKRNLENLFSTAEACGTGRLRELVVDLRPPQFKDIAEDSEQRGPWQNMGLRQQINLNEDQEQAVRMSFRAEDYLLILGMPGTGKTTTLAAIVLAKALAGESVLVCSHTNSAVDNLLLKLLDLKFTDFIRLGRNVSVVEKRIRPFHFTEACKHKKTIAELEKHIESTRVVAATCLGINHPALVRRNKFDLVVVDEASQILQPICLGPLQYASGPFILVGDHYQLPPLRRATKQTRTTDHGASNLEDRILGAHGKKEPTSAEDDVNNESLFRRLCVAHQQAMVALTKQYRMADEIMKLCNTLVYSGSLRCGSDEVANQMLSVSATTLRESPQWLSAVCSPYERVLFLDVELSEGANSHSYKEADAVQMRQPDGEQVRDVEFEADIVVKSVASLVSAGMAPQAVTVLSPFRAQVQMIREKISSARATDGTSLKEVKVSTIDQYQGKDNKCVIVSFGRSASKSVGPLLSDWRRLNVALTRAKQKLLLVGSALALKKGGPFLERMMQYLGSNGKVYSVR